MKHGPSLLAAVLVLSFSAGGRGEGVSRRLEIAEWSLIASSLAGALILELTPAWPNKPLIGGPTDLPYRESTVPSAWLTAGAGSFVAGVALTPNNDGWFNRTAYENVKGLLEAASINILLCSLTKSVTGRRRPSHDNHPSDQSINARKSFYSGHASSSFCLATYSSFFVFGHIGDNSNALHLAGKTLFAGSSHALASYVAYSRIDDNKHHLSDVLVGAVAGSAVSSVVYLLKNRRTTLPQTSPRARFLVSPTDDGCRVSLVRNLGG